jgi:hypothetical protein
VIILLVLGVIAILGAVLLALPAWEPVDLSGLIAAMHSGPGQSVFGALGWANHWLPITEIIATIALGLTVHAVVYLVRFVIWILQLFHIAGGGNA